MECGRRQAIVLARKGKEKCQKTYSRRVCNVMEERIQHIIYGYRSKLNGQWKIGCAMNPKQRHKRHVASKSDCDLFDNYLKARIAEGYSFDEVFDYFQLRVFVCTRRDAERWERIYTERYDALAPNGFCLKSGHYRGMQSVETCEKIGDAQKERVKNGSHQWLGENNPSPQRIADGAHHFQTDNPSPQRVKDGVHNFQTDNPNQDGKVSKRLLAEGSHNWQTEEHRKRTGERVKANPPLKNPKSLAKMTASLKQTCFQRRERKNKTHLLKGIK